MTIENLHTLFLKHQLIDTDTRKIRRNSLFFALKGENFNGNKFANEALNKGASYAIIDEAEYSGDHTILVDNVLNSLKQLANFHRKRLNIPIISLTGSNGKTTTKELINAVLSKKYKTSATTGNLNNHIGVPLTLLSMTSETEIGIVEMGANHLKEIELLCKIAEPNFGYITNFGKAHLEGFGSVEGVVKAKSELYDFLRNNGAKAFVNSDDVKQVQQSKGIEIITFNNEKIQFIEANPFVAVQFKKTLIKSQLIGKYNYQNIAAAIAIGNYFNVEVNEMKDAIENYIPSNNRSQIIQKGTNKIILDAYNANPSSMKVAIDNFAKLAAENKIICLGSMKELGEVTFIEHQALVEQLQQTTWTKVVLVGNEFKNCTHPYQFFESVAAAKKWLNEQNFVQHTILIKGSRGIQMEQLIAD